MMTFEPVVIQPHEEPEDNKDHDGDCFSTSAKDDPCFSASVSETECFYVKSDEDEEEEDEGGAPSIIVPGFLEIHEVWKRGLGELIIVGLYREGTEEDAPTDGVIAKISYSISPTGWIAEDVLVEMLMPLSTYGISIGDVSRLEGWGGDGGLDNIAIVCSGYVIYVDGLILDMTGDTRRHSEDPSNDPFFTNESYSVGDKYTRDYEKVIEYVKTYAYDYDSTIADYCLRDNEEGYSETSSIYAEPLETAELRTTVEKETIYDHPINSGEQRDSEFLSKFIVGVNLGTLCTDNICNDEYTPVNEGSYGSCRPVFYPYDPVGLCVCPKPLTSVTYSYDDAFVFVSKRSNIIASEHDIYLAQEDDIVEHQTIGSSSYTAIGTYMGEVDMSYNATYLGGKVMIPSDTKKITFSESITGKKLQSDGDFAGFSDGGTFYYSNGEISGSSEHTACTIVSGVLVYADGSHKLNQEVLDPFMA